MVDRTGDQLGTYRLIQRIGHGGYADIYLGKHIYLPRQAAIKILTTSLSEEQLRKFLSEAQTLATLNHPHIIRLLDFAIDNGDPYLVMEYAARGSLRNLHPRGTILKPETAAPMVAQIADALQYAHGQNVIHRDVKPENILVGPEDEMLLSDFGISVIEETSGLLANHTSVGTPGYMAPEQVMGSSRRASDQYSLAVVAYEWLCGQPPFTGTGLSVAMQHINEPVPPLRQHIPDLPENLEQVILRALSKEPEARFPNVRDFSQAFQESLQTTQRLQSSQSAGTMTPVQVPAKVQTSQHPVSVQPEKVPLKVGSTENFVFYNDHTVQVDLNTPVPASTPSKPASVPGRRRWLTIGVVALLLLLVTALVIQIPTTIGSIQASNNAAMTATAEAIPHVTATALAQAYQTHIQEHGTRTGFDMQHTGYNPYETVLSPTTVSRLTQRWSFPTGGKVISSPSVADGVIYVGSEDEQLYAIDAQTRAKRWTFSADEAISGSPTIVNGIVYIGSNDDNLYAIDAQSGTELWRFGTNNNIVSAPAVVNDVVYVSSGDGHLYALDAQSGTEIWDFRSNFLVSSSPSVADGVVYIGSWDKYLYALDAQSGEKIWSVRTRNFIHSSPAIANGVIYIGSLDNSLYAIDAQSGTELWQFEAEHDILSSPAIANGMVYFGSNDDNFYALDATTGEEKWRYLTGDDIVSSPLVANDVVYFGSNDHNLYALNATTGAHLWNHPADDAITSSPIVANGVVYVGSDDENVYAFSLSGA